MVSTEQTDVLDTDAILYGDLGKMFDDVSVGEEGTATKLTERVYHHVVSAIRSGELESNSRLTQRELASALKVSQVTVREAFERLAQHGLIERFPNRRGVSVKVFSARDREETYKFRELIEADAVRTVAEKGTDEQIGKLKKVAEVLTKACGKQDVGIYREADNQFHRLIVHFAGNAKFQQHHETLFRQIGCFVHAGAHKAAYHWVQSVELDEPSSHYNIYKAIASRDADLAEEMLRTHIKNANEFGAMVQRTRNLKTTATAEANSVT